MAIDRRGTRAGHRYELLGHSVHAPVKIEPFMITLDDTSDAYPVFQHAGYEFIYMLSGEVTYRHADRSYLLQPGDSLFFDFRGASRAGGTAPPAGALPVHHRFDAVMLGFPDVKNY